MNNSSYFESKALSLFSEFHTSPLTFLPDLSSVLPDRSFLIIGGFALSLYSKELRPLTPDLDILVSPSVLNILKTFLQKHSYSFSVHSLFGRSFLVVSSPGLEVDFVVASKSYEKEALKSPFYIRVRSLKLPVISPEYIALMKLDSLRDKDEQDLYKLFSSPFFNKDLFEKLLQRYLPSKKDDYESILSLSSILYKSRSSK